jgi:hypothetical protein
MTRVIVCLALALLIPVTVLAQQQPDRTPAQEMAARQCNSPCEKTAKCHLSQPGCAERYEACFDKCVNERTGNR